MRSVLDVPGAPSLRTRLSGALAIWAVAAMVAVVFMGATLITPLYPSYREAFGFSEITLTLIYAVYVVGNLVALLFLGRLSDQIGRGRVSLPALAVAGVSTLLFLLANTTAWLFWARMLSGFAVGLASGTGTAWLAELYGDEDKSRAALMASCANFVGLTIAPLMTGVLAQYARWPLHLTYVIYLVVLLVIAIVVARTQETVQPSQNGRHVSLRPRLGVPAAIRAQFIAPAVTAFGTFAFVGFYAALIPSILAERLHHTNRATAGTVVAELFLVATLVMVATRGLKSRTAMLSGLALLLPSIALLLLAETFASMPILVGGTALGGVAAALGYRGSLQVVNQIAPADQRAEVVSSYFVACFFGNSVPVIGVGVITAMSNSVVATVVFGCTVAAFAIAALATGVKYTPQP